MELGRSWAAWATILTVSLFAMAACGGSAEPTPQQTQEPTAQVAAVTAVPPASDASLEIFLASSDMGVGGNRIAFGLLGSDSKPLRNASNVRLATFFLTSAGQEGPIEDVKASFRQWPSGLGGVYTSQVSFDRAGDWGLGVVVTEADGSIRSGSARISVRETSRSPAIGSPAPRSASKTSRDVASLEELTSDSNPDPALYEMTIAEALDTGKPLVVTFATPAYCRSFTCGPQVDVIRESKAQHQGEANYIHIEVYDNPQEIQGDLSNARISPTFTEWNLPSEPWTFIVDARGLVYAKFEGFATIDELEDALSGVLQ